VKLTKIYGSNCKSKIRMTKHDLIKKPITMRNHDMNLLKLINLSLKINYSNMTMFTPDVS
jgi:hypothetical protein